MGGPTRRTPGGGSRGSASTTVLPRSISTDSSAAIRQSGVCADSYANGTFAKWQAARERGLPGRRELVLHRDPEVGAALLAEALGSRRAARAWLIETLEALR